MKFLQFIFYLGVIYITFDVLWKIFLFILRTALGINRRENFTYHSIKIAGYYLLVSLTALTTAIEIAQTDQLWMQVVFYFIGFAVLYFYITSAMEKTRMKAAVRMDVRELRMMKFNSIYLLASLVFYIIALYYPPLVQNTITLNLYGIIDYLFHTYLLSRWVIGFFAFLFLFNILYKGFIMTRYLIMALFGIRPSASRYGDRFAHSENHQTENAEYTIIEDDDDNNNPANNQKKPER